MNLKRIILKNKNFKLGYYLETLTHNSLPSKILQLGMRKWLSELSEIDIPYIKSRVDYYNQLQSSININDAPNKTYLANLSKPKQSKIYYYDIKKYLKYFDEQLPFLYKPGDNIDSLDLPHLVKSRPINGNNNQVVLKLNAIRHFNFIEDDIKFCNKKNILFGRLAVYQEHRKKFYEQYFHHHLCNLGDVAIGTKSKWIKPKATINDHLAYKFILALEGNDVATNLKWIMSSNSIAVMPKPKYETWFMEGKLIPGVHYIAIKDDYSDLAAQLNYYIQNPDKCLAIINAAHQWVNQFRDLKREHIINLLVLDKYFQLTE